ncbi:MAG: type VI secretion system protein TssA [Pseudomonadota bacterium]
MALDLDSLLASFGDDAPCGEDLEYDPDFIALELAAMPKEEQQVGDSVIEAEEPDYREVRDAALNVLQRSKDLRAIVYYCLAASKMDGISAIAEAMSYTRRCLEEYWDHVHPQLDADDDNDPTARVNAVRGLAGADTILKALRLTPLAGSARIGTFSLREVLIAKGEYQATDGVQVDTAAISSAFLDTPPEQTQSNLTAVKNARADLKAIETVFDDKVPGLGPDMVPLARLLRDLENALNEFGGAALEGDAEPEEADPEDAADGDTEGGVSAAPAARTAQPRGVGMIESRKDVLTAIDKICDYYAKNEPSSPVPLILKRAQKLVMADFMAILEDLAPGGLEQVKTVAGKPEDG